MKPNDFKKYAYKSKTEEEKLEESIEKMSAEFDKACKNVISLIFAVPVIFFKYFF